MINTLLITGENNHDWRRSAPFCKALLEDTGGFAVDMTEQPAATLSDQDALRRYQLFFLDYNGQYWGEAAQTHFVQAVHGGTGLVVLHSANNAFKGWAEYERMLGILFRNDAAHGDFHEFRVAIVDHDHPVSRGLSDFSLWDELYHRMVNTQGVPYRVLAAAYSDPARGGSGRHEPVMVALHHGEGRVYHSVLGHVWPGNPEGAYKGASMIAFENPSFQRSLLRGCEWAATGAVSEDER